MPHNFFIPSESLKNDSDGIRVLVSDRLTSVWNSNVFHITKQQAFTHLRSFNAIPSTHGAEENTRG